MVVSGMHRFRSRLSTLILAPLVLFSGPAVAGEDTPQDPQAKWVEAKDAGYPVDGSKMIDGVKFAQLLAKAMPETRISKVRNPEEWKKFIERFAQVDKDSGQPRFAAHQYPFASAPAKPDFAPDFGKEAVVVLAVDGGTRAGLGGFMDIELFRQNDKLDAFVFFQPSQGKKAAPSDPEVAAPAGFCFILTVPRDLIDQPVECRLAIQSWGRECSRFSPAMTGKP